MEPIVSLIQARMSSSRLPGKVLLPLGDGVVLDQVIRRANGFSSDVIVCTSIDPSDDAIAEHWALPPTPDWNYMPGYFPAMSPIIPINCWL